MDKENKTLISVCIGIVLSIGIAACIMTADSEPLVQSTYCVEMYEPSWNVETAQKGIVSCQEIPKDPYVVNKGNVDAYVFLEVIIPYYEVSNNSSEKEKIPVFKFVDSNGEYEMSNTFRQNVNEGWELFLFEDDETNMEFVYVYAYEGEDGKMTKVQSADNKGSNSTETPLFNKLRYCNANDSILRKGKPVNENSYEVNISIHSVQSQFPKADISAPEDAWELCRTGYKARSGRN